MVWQQVPRPSANSVEEIKPLFQSIQNLLMKVLLLDRENQQIMLRRGLVPASHLPGCRSKTELRRQFVSAKFRLLAG